MNKRTDTLNRLLTYRSVLVANSLAMKPNPQPPFPRQPNKPHPSPSTTLQGDDRNFPRPRRYSPSPHCFKCNTKCQSKFHSNSDPCAATVYNPDTTPTHMPCLLAARDPHFRRCPLRSFLQRAPRLSAHIRFNAGLHVASLPACRFRQGADACTA